MPLVALLLGGAAVYGARRARGSRGAKTARIHPTGAQAEAGKWRSMWRWVPGLLTSESRAKADKSEVGKPRLRMPWQCSPARVGISSRGTRIADSPSASSNSSSRSGSGKSVLSSSKSGSGKSWFGSGWGSDSGWHRKPRVADEAVTAEVDLDTAEATPTCVSPTAGGSSGSLRPRGLSAELDAAASLPAPQRIPSQPPDSGKASSAGSGAIPTESVLFPRGAAPQRVSERGESSGVEPSELTPCTPVCGDDAESSMQVLNFDTPVVGTPRADAMRAAAAAAGGATTRQVQMLSLEQGPSAQVQCFTRPEVCSRSSSGGSVRPTDTRESLAATDVAPEAVDDGKKTPPRPEEMVPVKAGSWLEH